MDSYTVAFRNPILLWLGIATSEVQHDHALTFEQRLVQLPFELREHIYNYAFRDSIAVVTDIKDFKPAETSPAKQGIANGQWGPYSSVATWILSQASPSIRRELLRAFIRHTKWEVRCPYNEASQLAPDPEEETCKKTAAPLAAGNTFVNFVNLLDSLGYSHLIRNLTLQSPVFETPTEDLLPLLKRLPNLQSVAFTPGSWIIRGPIYPEATLSIDVPLCCGERVYSDAEILEIFKNGHIWKTHSIYNCARKITELGFPSRGFSVSVSFLVREGRPSGMGIVFPHDWESKVCTWDVDTAQVISFEKMQTRSLVYLSGGGGVSVVSQR